MLIFLFFITFNFLFYLLLLQIDLACIKLFIFNIFFYVKSFDFNLFNIHILFIVLQLLSNFFLPLLIHPFYIFLFRYLFRISRVMVLGCPNLLSFPTPINATFGLTFFINSSQEELLEP